MSRTDEATCDRVVGQGAVARAAALLVLFALAAAADNPAASETTPDEAAPHEAAAARATATETASSKSAADTPKELFKGRVVLLEAALREKGVDTYEETGKHVVLQTPEGELIPILADWRGRAFYQDPQLRDRDVELIGFRRPGMPYLNVIAVYSFDEAGRRMYTDYWCDICSIPMYQIQPCECCQGDVRLRFQEQELPEYVKGGKGGR